MRNVLKGHSIRRVRTAILILILSKPNKDTILCENSWTRFSGSLVAGTLLLLTHVGNSYGNTGSPPFRGTYSLSEEQHAGDRAQSRLNRSSSTQHLGTAIC